MKVAFTGTRYGLTAAQLKALRALLNSLPIREFHHGNCIGADTQAHHMVLGKAETHIWPSDNESTQSNCVGYRHYPPGPPLERNKDIVKGADICIACPNGAYVEQRSGTWAAVRYALKNKVPVTVIWPYGHVETNFKLTEQNHGA